MIASKCYSRGVVLLVIYHGTRVLALESAVQWLCGAVHCMGVRAFISATSFCSIPTHIMYVVRHCAHSYSFVLLRTAKQYVFLFFVSSLRKGAVTSSAFSRPAATNHCSTLTSPVGIGR
jgi:hypothetical protein